MTARIPPRALLQGLRVLLTTPRLAPPAGEAGHFGNGAAIERRVVGIGDSVAAGTGVQRLQDCLTACCAQMLHQRTRLAVAWQVCGRNGATSATVLQDLVPVVPPGDVYVISVGVNDVTRRVTPAVFARNLGAIHDGLRARSPAAAVVFAGLPPLELFPALPAPLNAVLGERARELQQAAAEILASRPSTCCYRFPDVVPPGEFASDGFHPAESAVRAWAAGLIALLVQDEVASCSR
jgi:lysophospholipase L1-like esterase